MPSSVPASSVENIVVARRIFPFQFEGLVSRKVFIPQELFGALVTGYNVVEKIYPKTGWVRLPWSLTLPWPGQTNKYFWLMKREFYTVLHLKTVDDQTDRQYSINAKIKIILNDHRNQGANFSNTANFYLEKLLKEEQCNIFADQVSQWIVQDLCNTGIHKTIEQLSQWRWDDFDTQRLALGLEYDIRSGQCLQDAEFQVVEVFVNPSPLVGLPTNGIRPVMMKKNHDTEPPNPGARQTEDKTLKRIKWYSNLSRFLPVAPLIVGLLILLIQGLSRGKPVQGPDNVFWFVFVAIWLLFLFFSPVVVRALFQREFKVKKEKKPEDRKNPLEIEVDIWFLILSLAILIGLAFETIVKGWPAPYSGYFLAVAIVLLARLIPMDVLPTPQMILFVGIPPFLLMMFHSSTTPLIGLMYILLIVWITLSAAFNREILGGFIAIATPFLILTGWEYAVPVLLGLIFVNRFGIGMVVAAVSLLSVIFVEFLDAHWALTYKDGLFILIQSLVAGLSALTVSSISSKGGWRFDLLAVGCGFLILAAGEWGLHILVRNGTYIFAWYKLFIPIVMVGALLVYSRIAARKDEV